MSWPKRIVAAVVSICLLGAAIFLSYQPEAVNAGAGSGVNAPIQSMTDLDKVFTSMEHLGSSVGNTARAATAEDFYTSMSISETSDVSSESSVSSEYGSASSSSSFRRKLDIYLTEGAAYYVSRGVTSSRTSQTVGDERKEESVYFAFDFRIYMSAERVLIKADEIEYYVVDSSAGQEAVSDPLLDALRANRGEWLDCTGVPEVADQLLNINSTNMDTMDRIGELIDLAQEDDTLFTQNGSLYTCVIPPDAGLDGELTIDFSNAVAPYLNFDVSVSGGNGASGSVREKIEFRYVDNTVISLKDTVETVDLAAWMAEEEN